MSLLVETIKISNGIMFNIDYHSERFNRTRRELFGTGIPIDLRTNLMIPAYVNHGLFKCRIEYDDNIRKIEFIPYEIRSVMSLRMIEAGDLEYGYKFIDRDGIDKLYDQRHECDDILMVKDGRVTDTSYANIVLRGSDKKWYTPSSCLLPGTKRAYLLDKGIVSEREVTPASLRKYRELRLINSMLDINDTESIPIKTICF